MMHLGGLHKLTMDMVIIMSSAEIAELLNVRYDNETGRLFLTMEVIDPVWRQKILTKWQDLNVKLVVEDKDIRED